MPNEQITNKGSKDSRLEHDLRRLVFDLGSRYGVKRIGYFYDYTNKHALQPVEVNIIVELDRPMGWKFFQMKEFLERKLDRRIDIVTPNGLKVLFEPEISAAIKWL